MLFICPLIQHHSFYLFSHPQQYIPNKQSIKARSLSAGTRKPLIRLELPQLPLSLFLKNRQLIQAPHLLQEYCCSFFNILLPWFPSFIYAVLMSEVDCLILLGWYLTDILIPIFRRILSMISDSLTWHRRIEVLRIHSFLHPLPRFSLIILAIGGIPLSLFVAKVAENR
jgi:hypothetical protein